MQQGLLIILVLIVITGCTATNPRINLDKVAVNDDRATVVFFRPKAFRGNFMDFDLIANATLIGQLGNGKTVTHQLMPGEYKFHSNNGVR